VGARLPKDIYINRRFLKCNLSSSTAIYILNLIPNQIKTSIPSIKMETIKYVVLGHFPPTFFGSSITNPRSRNAANYVAETV
jgi:hypothetical protein